MALLRSFIGATVPGASFLFNKTFLRIALVVIITVLLGFFGYLKYQDYREAKAKAAADAIKVVVQEEKIEQITKTNQNNTVDTETVAKSGELSMTTVLDTSKIKQKAEVNTKKIITKKDDRKKQIDEELENSPKSEADVKSAAQKTVENNLNAMWDAYCLHSGDKTTQCAAHS